MRGGYQSRESGLNTELITNAPLYKIRTEKLGIVVGEEPVTLMKGISTTWPAHAAGPAGMRFSAAKPAFSGTVSAQPALLFGDTFTQSGQPAGRRKASRFARNSVALLFALLTAITPGIRLARPAYAMPPNESAITYVINAQTEQHQQIQQQQVAVEAAQVESAADIPALPAGSTQRVIDLKSPFLDARTRDYIQSQLRQIEHAGYAGKVYLVVIPGTSRNIDALSQEILNKLNPDGDGAIILMNAGDLAKDHASVKHVRTYLQPIPISNGKTTTIIMVPRTDINYILGPAMLGTQDGHALFERISDMLDKVEPQVSDNAELRGQLEILREDLQKDPVKVRQEIEAWFDAQIRRSKTDEARTVYDGDFNQVATDLVNDFARLYTNPPEVYLNHMKDQAATRKVLIGMAIGAGILGAGTGGYFIVRHLTEDDRW